MQASDDPADLARSGPADLVVFAVKLSDTAPAARALGQVLGPHTRSLTLQNGIDHIKPHVGTTMVRGGVIYVSAVIDRPGVIHSPGGLHVIVADAAGGDAVMAAFFAACGLATGLQAKPTDDIRSTLWEKFIALTALSATTSLLRAPMGRSSATPRRALRRQLVEDAVAEAAGVPQRDGMVDEVMAKLAGMPASFRSSMSEDPARGKPLELNWLSGRVHALGQQLGVPTPATAPPGAPWCSTSTAERASESPRGRPRWRLPTQVLGACYGSRAAAYGFDRSTAELPFVETRKRS